MCSEDGKFKQLTTEERKVIIKLHEEGKETYREIGKMYGKTPAAIYKITKTYTESGSVPRYKQLGRASDRVDRRIEALVQSDPFMSGPKIRAKLIEEHKSRPSVETIRRRIHEVGRHGRTPRKLPHISKVNKKKRLQFYEQHALLLFVVKLKYPPLRNLNIYMTLIKVYLKALHYEKIIYAS